MLTHVSIINFGGVNSYLIKTQSSFILIDNGYPAKRNFLIKKLEQAGCLPGEPLLVILTHGDHDHAGNSAYLQEKFSAQIALHADDLLMVEKGDMNWNRKKRADKFSFLFKTMSLFSVFFNPGEFKTFRPDISLDEKFDFSPYSLDARIVHIPGHSKGSVGLLTGDGNLFCGDFLYNFFGSPRLEFCDNLSDFRMSLEKLKKFNINIVYPGHGKPFPLEKYLRKQKSN